MDRSSANASVMAAGRIAGMNVENPQGEHLGKVVDLMIDLPSGRVAYAVLSFGGFLGVGNKLFAIPLAAFRVRAKEHKLLLDVDKEDLKDAPGFDKEHWPDMNDRRWGTEIHSYYGLPPYW
jgi:sporulation protein YlmC with PRC-barrel domain